MSEIDNYLEPNDVKKMSDDELTSVYKSLIIESDIYGSDKSDSGYIRVWGMRINLSIGNFSDEGN